MFYSIVKDKANTWFGCVLAINKRFAVNYEINQIG